MATTQIKNIKFNDKNISIVVFSGVQYFYPEKTVTHYGSVEMTFYKKSSSSGALITSYTPNNATVNRFWHGLASQNGSYDYNGDTYSLYNYALYEIDFTVAGQNFVRQNFEWAGKNKVTFKEVLYAHTQPSGVSKTEYASWVQSIPIYSLYF